MRYWVTRDTVGRSADFERTSTLARELIENRTDTEPEPRWMYFLTPNHLACQSGYALINLGRSEAERGDRARGRRLVRQGQDLLETGAYMVEKGHPSQRRALFEGSWLALEYSASGELERSCEVGERAAARLSTVRSPRSTALLGQLATELRRKQRNPYVRDFLPELEERIAKQPGPGNSRPVTVAS
jgi:hypothetical protein